MQDLIRRQSAINAIENTDVPMAAEEWNELTDAIVSIPAVDAVEVVRCRDCKWWKSNDCKNDTHGYVPLDENDFCSHGQRREDGDAFADIHTVDAVEVKHGRWMFEEYPDGYYSSYCSLCGFSAGEDAYLSDWNYCPACGARMD